MRKALILSTVSGFLCKFESENVRLLQELGYDVHYAANMDEQQYRFDSSALDKMGVTTHHISIARSPLMLKMNRNAYKQTKELVAREKIQLIHCHTPVGGFVGRLLGFKFGKKVKVAYTAHGFHFYKGAPAHRKAAFYLAERIMARCTDALITINEEDYKASRKFKLRKGGKGYLLSGVGVDFEKFVPASLEENVKNRAKEGIEADIFHLATVGEINENKNHRVVLEAIQLMKQGDPKLGEKIRYTISGDGFYTERIANEIKTMGLEDVVKLKSYSMDVRNSLSTVDAFVFPSIREGLGMAAIEALTMGIPVIASDNRGTREFMRHKQNGFVCKENVPKEYIKGIEYIRNLGSKELNEIKKICRESVVNFCKCNTRKVMSAVYQDMAKERVEIRKSLCACKEG